MTESDASTKSVELPRDLVGFELEPLRNALLGALAAGGDLVLRGDAVTRVGTPALQILLATLIEAERQGSGVRLELPSPALLDALRITGLAQNPSVQRALG